MYNIVNIFIGGIMVKIIFDIDATVTKFSLFIEKHAIPYFLSKGMKIINKDALEIEDIFDMENYFINEKGCSANEAKKLVKKELDDFWVGFNFVKFSLLNCFRNGVKEYINNRIKEGHEIEIHTSRAKTSEKSLIGTISSEFTILQFILNGIKLPRNKYKFYENDDEKIKGIIASKPDLVFEDKPYIIEKLTQHDIKTFCVLGNHNKDITKNKNLEIIETFDENNIFEKKKNLIGVRKLQYYERAAKAKKMFSKFKLVKLMIPHIYKPILLNIDNLKDYDQEAVIFAPNHMKTLDPIIITSVIGEQIHWAALLRFFEGEDSIFNNNKGVIFRKITAKYFPKLEYFPIERLSDNPKANNLNSIKDMYNFLVIKQKLGIFPEGTTRKGPGREFGDFDDGFVKIAKKTNAYIQPITSLWINELKLKNKIIINFSKPFKIENMEIKEALDFYRKIQENSLEENKLLREKLIKEKNKIKKLTR